MQEPSVRTSRLAIAGGLAAALLVGGAGFLVGRATAPPPPVVQPVVAPAAAPAEPKPAEPQILDRGAIVAVAGQAADALASAKPLPDPIREISGRRFSVSLPFGCAGPAGPDSPAPLRWHYDDATQTLRVHVALVVWQRDEWGLEAADTAVPQGFWVTRPWSSGETCPAAISDTAATGTAPVTLPGQVLALVSFNGNEPKAPGGYDAVVRIPRDKITITQGLRARITGRIDHVPGDGPVRCVQPAGIEQHPICAVAAVFDELVVDNPASGETIATWAIGSIEERSSDPGRAKGR